MKGKRKTNKTKHTNKKQNKTKQTNTHKIITSGKKYYSEENEYLVVLTGVFLIIITLPFNFVRD